MKRRLLFVSPRFLFPSDSGGKIRTRDILRGLKGGEFDITLASPEAPAASGGFRDDLARVCDRFVGWPPGKRGFGWRMHRYLSVGSRLPVAVASDRSDSGRRVVEREIAHGCDLIVADFPHATVLVPERLPVPGVLFTHNVEAEIFRRHALVAQNPVMRRLWTAQAEKMARFEEAAARRFDAIVVVSQRDAEHFRKVVAAARVFPISTGVDLEYFHYQPPPGPVPKRGGTLVFTGSMDWLANIDGIRYLMDEIWPRAVAVRPQLQMVVVGHSPPGELVRAAKERGLAWRFTGFVDDVRMPVHAAHAYLIPLRVGGGTRIKAFEAMALGCPVVATTIGVEGLPVNAGEHCVSGDAAESFTAALLQVLDDEDLRQTLSVNARRLVEDHYSFRTAAREFEAACVASMTMRDGTAPLRFGEPRAA